MNHLPDPNVPAVFSPAAGRCAFCQSPGLRRARFRPGDTWRLLLGRWPVRCMECRKRQYAAWSRARLAVSSRAAHAGELRSTETWQGFTSESGSHVAARTPDKDIH